MSVELARWLTDQQMHLLPRWVSAVNGTAFSNGTGASTQEMQPLDTLNVQSLTYLYEGLVQAAQGNFAPLETHLQSISYADGQADNSLPNLINTTFQLRRLAWKSLEAEDLDKTSMFELMHALEELFDHIVDVLSRSWMESAETMIKARMDEAEFIAQSMNVAIEQVDRTAVQLSSLNELSQELSSSLESSDSAHIIEVVGSKLMDILQVAHVSIWLPDEELQQKTSEVVLYAVQSWGEEHQPVTGMHLTVVIDETWPNDLVTQCYMLSQIVTAIDPLPEPEVQGPWYQAGCSVIALPLMVKDHATGVVVMQDAMPTEHLTPAQQDTLRAVVNQAAIALDNSRLYMKIRRFNSELEKKVEQRTRELQAEKDRLSTLHAIATEVSSTLDLDSLLHSSLEALARITQVEYGSIMLVDHETEHLVSHAVLGSEQIDTFMRFPPGHGVAGWVAQHKRPALIADVNQDERWIKLPLDNADEEEEGESSRKARGSMLSVPLIAHDQTQGVLTLSHPNVGYFNDDHQRLLVASAGAIAIGIHNANLYTEIVKEMEYRSELLRNQQMETSKIEAILLSLADGVLVCDTEGAVLSANPTCGDILNRKVEDLILSDLHDVLKWLLGRRVDELPLDELLERPLGSNNAPRIFESTVDIGVQVVNLKLGPVLKEDGELVGALLMMRDKTREVESDRLKTEFIGTMSHELRTPMTSIKGFTQLLVMGSLGPVNDTQREFLNTIQSNAERMICIINDVLELTKIETGSIDLEIRPLHLAEALSGVVSGVQEMVNKREHTLNISIPPGLPLVRADAGRLNQVLNNLISNAIKYTPSGGEIQVEAHEANLEELPHHVRDSVMIDRRYTQINVTDTGVGIDEHELEKVFERFYRTENPLKIEAGGTGLGLSLTRPLIELLGGRIWVTSTPGQGSTFSFILPAV